MPESRAGAHSIPDELQLLQVIALSLLAKPVPVVAAEMKYLRKECDLTQAQVDKILGETREMGVEREGGRPIDADTEYRYRAAIFQQLAELLTNRSRNQLAGHHMKELENLRYRFTSMAIRKARRARKTMRTAHDGS